jgi:hypothetical protein
MAKTSGSTDTGAAAFKPGPQGVPREVQASFLLWLTAVAAGVVETIVRVIDSLTVGSSSGGEADVTGVAIRVIVYTVAVYIIAQMRLGKRWARITLAVLLGVIGTLSLVIDPISWLAGANSTAWWHLLGVETRRLRSIRCPVVYQGVATRNTATTSQEAQASRRAG